MADRLHNLRQAWPQWCCRHRIGARRAFTIVEMLIVVAIIILLLSILIVALSAAARASQAASTSVRMGQMKNSIVTFKKDVGYYPPILNLHRGLYLTTALDPINNGYSGAIQNYSSYTSCAEYLLGPGPRTEDGYGAPIGNNTDSERPPFGIRSPGEDGVWDSTLSGGGGTLAERQPKTTGNIIGPYLEFSDKRLIASVDGSFNPAGQLNVFFPGESGYNESDPKVIVDYWGRPIQYFRRPYPAGGIRTGYRPVDRNGDGITDPVPSLGDIFVLRPFDIPPGQDISGRADSSGDTATTVALNTAEFALFSSGADLTANAKVRYDDAAINPAYNSNNRDNIVELGP